MPSLPACSRLALTICVASTCALWAARARAEGEPEGQDPYCDASGAFIGGGNTNGFVLQSGDGWAQVCMESFQSGNIAADFSTVLADNSLVVGGVAGVGVSTDLGCSFSVSPDLAGRHVASLVVVGGTLFTCTEDATRANGIWMSIDGGNQWTQAYPEQSGLLVFDLVASADGQRIAATGLHTSDGSPAVLVSENAGISFDDVSAGYSTQGFFRVRAATFDVDDQAILFGGFDGGADSGFVLHAAPPYDAPERIGTFVSEIRHVAIFNGARYALDYLPQTTFKETPGDASFTQIADKSTGPGSCLFAKPDGSGLVGCGKQGSRPPLSPMFLESSDGATWNVIMNFPDVPYRNCPAGTPGAAECARFIESSQCTDGLDNDFDGLTDCDDPDCANTPACGGTGEGEGEGAGAGEGEGEGTRSDDAPPPARVASCACDDVNGAPLGASLCAFAGLSIALGAALRRRR
ncbi:MAG TPA: hypothetical protein VGO62_03070 [Myxococcota bacterium]